VATARLADLFTRLEPEGRGAFLHLLLREFSPDPAAVGAAVEEYRQGEGAPGAGTLKLMRALESPAIRLFQQLNTIPQGIKFLTDLRGDLLTRLPSEPELELLEHELRRLLEAYFNPGFLELRRITWQSPAAFLENLVSSEAVHEITNWRDLKHRLVTDRACFAYVHPAMPNEPIIFVEVALVNGMADNIQRLLDPAGLDLRPEEADTAIFYSISNAQKGLRGIPFGNLLIKQVTARLRGEWPNLSTFATLSPLPRLREDFLVPGLADGSLAKHYKEKEVQRLCEVTGRPTARLALDYLLGLPDWRSDPAAAEALRPGLLRAARTYLTERQYHGHAACPVAHFHGSNGALLARLNWLGDTSPKGLRQSAGIMVNYRYDLGRFERYQDEYSRTGRLPLGKAAKDL
jgi:malonyl-CoA decarboxylase